jgi:hypothetical protein
MDNQIADRIRERNRKRFEFLQRLYEVSEGSTTHPVDMYIVGEYLGFSRAQTERVVEYLADESLLRKVSTGGTILMTHPGRLQVEDALANPDQPTDYFPALNYIYVDTMLQSQIQQGTEHSTQTVTYGEQNAEALQELVQEFRDRLPDFDLDETTDAQARADLASLEPYSWESPPRQVPNSCFPG